MPLLGFSLGVGDSNAIGAERSLDDMIADRRKAQAKTSTGRRGGTTTTSSNRSTATNTHATRKQQHPNKKKEVVDRSVATQRAKRSAATRARRGLSTTKQPSAKELEREHYRQARTGSNTNTTTTTTRTKNKKKQQQQQQQSKKGGKGLSNNNNNNNSHNTTTTTTAVADGNISLGRVPSKKQLKAAAKGMAEAGCPIPEGYSLTIQFIPNGLPTTTSSARGANNSSAASDSFMGGNQHGRGYNTNNHQKGGRVSNRRGRK